jgi:hypothetical protein
VYRGCLWLDAIVTYTPNVSNGAHGLAVVLKRTKQYSQIQAAIFSRDNIFQHKYEDFRSLSRLVRFPVFVISKALPAKLPRREFLCIRLNNNRILLWINDIDPERARELYVLGCSDGQCLPEAVRTAELVAEGLKQSQEQMISDARRKFNRDRNSVVSKISEAQTKGSSKLASGALESSC